MNINNFAFIQFAKNSSTGETWIYGTVKTESASNSNPVAFYCVVKDPLKAILEIQTALKSVLSVPFDFSCGLVEKKPSEYFISYWIECVQSDYICLNKSTKSEELSMGQLIETWRNHLIINKYENLNK